jgi:phosphotransferase system HPr (HPr) family protein
MLENSLTKTATVNNALGLHARPAAMIANLALKARAGVWLCKDEEQVDASSIIDILSLSCLKGTEVRLRIENPEDRNILNEISHLFENDFGEKL